MKTVFRLVGIMIFSAALSGAADFGAGILLGDPTGLCGTVRFSKTRALDLALSYDLGDDADLYLHGDYIFRSSTFIKEDDFFLPFFFGPGAALSIVTFERWNRRDFEYEEETEARLYFRFPAGFLYNFAKHGADLDIFLELAPALRLIPDMDADIFGALGIRYFF
ncbi:MAG: hypothetical protein ACLFQK_07400 [Fibrobacterota bacterium]